MIVSEYVIQSGAAAGATVRVDDDAYAHLSAEERAEKREQCLAAYGAVLRRIQRDAAVRIARRLTANEKIDLMRAAEARDDTKIRTYVDKYI